MALLAVDMLGPIFDRELLTLPRRVNHYLTRFLFLGALWVLILTIWQTTFGWERTPSLGDQARFGLVTFQVLVYVQLILLLFFSALTAASTIAQEKDRRTFLLLLLTDLRNHEIVLGKLFGSLLQIGLFLAGTVPILMLLVLMGGIGPDQVIQATLVLATTALAAGSLGGLIALWRDRTFQALALTVLFLVLYLCLVRALGLLSLLPGDFFSSNTIEHYQAWLEPFLVVESILDPLHAPQGVVLPPAYGFALVMLGWAVLLNGLGIVRLRVWNPSGETIRQREVADEPSEKDRALAHAAPGEIRKVWANPILWREIATRAYGRRPLLVKTAYFLVVGLIAYFALNLPLSTAWAAAYGLVPIGILSLLLLSAQAVTSITSERDTGSLDLLMVTDLTPQEFIFGKIWGIVYNAKEYLLPPIVLIALYAYRGQLATPPLPANNIESAVSIALAWIILASFTVVFGIHVALRNEQSRVAILNTLGTMFFLSVGTLVCIYLILINRRFEYQWLSFSGFIFAGVGGLWWVLNGDRPSTALTLASWICPFAVFYAVTNILIGRPGRIESADPMLPFIVVGGAFGFTVTAMLVPLLSEFDVAIGRTSAGGD